MGMVFRQAYWCRLRAMGQREAGTSNILEQQVWQGRHTGMRLIIYSKGILRVEDTHSWENGLRVSLIVENPL